MALLDAKQQWTGLFETNAMQDAKQQWTGRSKQTQCKMPNNNGLVQQTQMQDAMSHQSTNAQTQTQNVRAVLKSLVQSKQQAHQVELNNV